ncbi:hypothetical protein CAEBREN_11136 [Caenorhabditis brenneri]|uniref:F-box associated domain-containing protein n=1 Tax=Caenorhabditis brenneri TaxID=135651 RepID=G0NTS2_CAEBE|nr:hypothetical protein CAEBREN_11136 [Caenorhabditis brenneri]
MPREGIFENMTMIELWDFTRISERMKDFVEEQVHIANVQLVIHIDDAIAFEFFSTTDGKKVCSFTAEPTVILDEEDSLFHQNIGRFQDVPSAYLEPIEGNDDDTPMMGTYWDDYLIGGKALFKELDEIFHMPIKHVLVDMMKTGGLIRGAVEWINQLSERIPEIMIRGSQENGRFMWIMDALKPKGRLIFKFDGEEDPQTHELDVRISDSNWVRPYHFNSWRSAIKMTMLESTMTAQEIREVLVQIKQGLFKNLVLVMIYFRGPFRNGGCLDDVNATMDERFRWHFDCDNGDKAILTFTHVDAIIDADGIQIEFVKKINNALETIQENA